MVEHKFQQFKPMRMANDKMPKKVRFGAHDAPEMEYPEDIRIPIFQEGDMLLNANGNDNKLIVASILLTAVVTSMPLPAIQKWCKTSAVNL